MSSFAAVYVLGVLGADAELASASAVPCDAWREFESRTPASTAPKDRALAWPTGDVAAYALASVDRLDGPAVRPAITRVVGGEPRSVLTAAASSALPRSKDPSEEATILAATQRGDGFARGALVRAADPRFVAQFASSFADELTSASGKHVTRSAARRLLASGEAAAAEEFVRIAVGASGASGPAYRALKDAPQSATRVLLDSRSRSPRDVELAPRAVEIALEAA